MNEALYLQAFQRSPYRWNTVGFMEDLERITLEEAKRLLPDLLRAQQRHHGPRRRRRPEVGAARSSKKLLRRHPAPAAAGAGGRP